VLLLWPRPESTAQFRDNSKDRREAVFLLFAAHDSGSQRRLPTLDLVDRSWGKLTSR
jgi:hypothetical protein